jgi:hypothetical protein
VSNKGPWLPPRRENCNGRHVQIIALNGEVARCRYCNHLVTPGGRVSKNKLAPEARA